MLFLGTLILGTGCFPAANSQISSRPSVIEAETEAANADQEDYVETEPATTVEDDPGNPRSNARQVQRRREHRQSMNNIGSWLLVAAIGIGINVLLAIVLSQ